MRKLADRVRNFFANNEQWKAATSSSLLAAYSLLIIHYSLLINDCIRLLITFAA